MPVKPFSTLLIMIYALGWCKKIRYFWIQPPTSYLIEFFTLNPNIDEKKSPISGSRTASFLAFLMEKRVESGASSGLKPGISGFLLILILKLCRLLISVLCLVRNPSLNLFGRLQAHQSNFEWPTGLPKKCLAVNAVRESVEPFPGSTVDISKFDWWACNR